MRATLSPGQSSQSLKGCRINIYNLYPFISLWCVCVCCMPMSVRAHACTYRNWSSTLGVILSHLPLYCLETVSQLTRSSWDRISQLTRSSLFLARLPDKFSELPDFIPSVELSGTHSQAQPFLWVMRILTQVLMLTEQALSPTSPSTLSSVCPSLSLALALWDDLLFCLLSAIMNLLLWTLVCKWL